MRRRRIVAFAALLGWLVALAAPAAAFIPVLSDRDIEAAIQAGEKGIAQEDFDQEWRVPLAEGAEIEVTTPFSRLAAAARRAAFKNESLNDKQRQEQIDRGKGKIQLLVTMFGKTVDFAKWYDPVLRVGGQEIKPTFVQPERTALKLDDGRFAARNIFVFPVDKVPGQASVTLVVRDRIAQKEVFKTSLDLSKMR